MQDKLINTNRPKISSQKSAADRLYRAVAKKRTVKYLLAEKNSRKVVVLLTSGRLGCNLADCLDLANGLWRSIDSYFQSGALTMPSGGQTRLKIDK